MISLPGFEGYWSLPAAKPRKRKARSYADLWALPPFTTQRKTTPRKKKKKNIKKKRNKK